MNEQRPQQEGNIPDVSIIVPMYQSEGTIARCLDSLLAQTLRNIEVIVVNDGSTDSSPRIVEEYAQKDNRVSMHTQQNAGPGAAINTGLRKAKGEYIGLVGSDDTIEPQMYEEMLAAARQSDTQMSLCLIRNVMENKNGIWTDLDNPVFPETLTTVPQEKLLDWFLNSMHIELNSVCQKLTARSVFEENDITFPVNYRYGEDQVVSARLFCHVPAAAIVHEKFYNYIHRISSYTYAYSAKNANDVLMNYKDISIAVSESGYKGQLSNFALSMMFSSLKQVYRAKQSKDEEGIKLIREWKRLKKENAWKPDFRNLKIPLAHRVKIMISYLGLVRLMCFIINKLHRIPFFRYMT